MIPRLKENFIKKIQPTLKEKFGFKNINMTPQIKKVVLNIPAGSLVLWDSRTFHQNQYGKPNSEERIVHDPTKMFFLFCFEDFK